MDTPATPQKRTKAVTIHNPYKRLTPTETRDPPIISPQSIKSLIEKDIYTQPSIILHLHDSAMDLYTKLDDILTAIVSQGSSDITPHGRELVLATVQEYVESTINLNNNTCGNHLSKEQRDLTFNLLSSVLNYIGAPHTHRVEDLTKPTAHHQATPKRQRTTHDARDTLRQTQEELALLLARLTNNNYAPIPMGPATADTASPLNALRCAMWYNHATAQEIDATIKKSEPKTYTHSYRPNNYPLATNITIKIPPDWKHINVSRTPIKDLFSATGKMLLTAQPINWDYDTVFHYPIVAEFWCPGSQSEDQNHATFITIHQPSQTFVICDKRHNRQASNPFIYRYGTILREADTTVALSKNIAQKIFPAWHAKDKYNGNSRTQLNLLQAYAIVPPSRPPFIPHIQQQTHTAPDGTATHRPASAAKQNPIAQTKTGRSANAANKRSRETIKTLAKIRQNLSNGKYFGNPSQPLSPPHAQATPTKTEGSPTGNPKDPNHPDYNNLANV